MKKTAKKVFTLNQLGNMLERLSVLVVEVIERVEKLEGGQERIERKLDHAIYEAQFEKLERRVKVVEKKVGLAS